jgi:hypothetical protein
LIFFPVLFFFRVSAPFYTNRHELDLDCKPNNWVFPVFAACTAAIWVSSSRGFVVIDNRLVTVWCVVVPVVVPAEEEDEVFEGGGTVITDDNDDGGFVIGTIGLAILEEEGTDRLGLLFVVVLDGDDDDEGLPPLLLLLRYVSKNSTAFARLSALRSWEGGRGITFREEEEEEVWWG